MDQNNINTQEQIDMVNNMYSMLPRKNRRKLLKYLKKDYKTILMNKLKNK